MQREQRASSGRRDEPSNRGHLTQSQISPLWTKGLQDEQASFERRDEITRITKLLASHRVGREH
jgi:hypothetical protein